MIDEGVAVAVLLAFAWTNGVNDGGTIVAAGSRVASSHPWLPVVILLVALAAGPLVSTRVADTLASRLVSFEGQGGAAALTVALVATLAVVWLLTRQGLPTSLTLGLVGAIAGAGLAAGLPVGWSTIGWVLLVAAAAPAVGLIGAYLLQRAGRPLLGPMPRVRRALPRVGFLLQCLAYATNDGQKMLAATAVVVSVAVTEVGAGWWLLTVATFGAGTVLGFARIGPTLSAGVLPLRTEEAGYAQIASGAAVLGSAAIGSPVSLTQAVTGGLVGAGVGITPRRVRWRPVARIAIAWTLTLPAAFVLAALLGLALASLP